ncbi:hypothetical protein, partial [Staphylococcus haemolyticus]|uniref:hypothetical protein n=1 Tax=Staphylococcus haemolyticus TaxID=1283 RepID=UPI001C5CA27D
EGTIKSRIVRISVIELISTSSFSIIIYWFTNPSKRLFSPLVLFKDAAISFFVLFIFSILFVLWI